jgi:putative ABC transport system permease protein
MLHGWAEDPVVVKGALQVAAALVPAVAVIGLSRLRELELEAEIGVSLVRGLVQILAIGSVLGLLLSVQLAWSGLILAAMMVAAAVISHRQAFWVSLGAITSGTGIVIVAMTWAGAIETTVRNLVPVGSMIIYAGLKTNSLALDRLRGELDSQRDRIETRLALGASGTDAMRPEVRTSVKASLIPVVDSLRSLGLVWIPGMMAGMVLSGANPIYAAEYQFVIMGMVFGASGLTAVATTALMSHRVFNEAHQLRVEAT